GSPEPGLAFEEMVRTYARLIRAAVGRVSGGRAASVADDVEQRVFLQLWRQVKNEQKIRHLSSYIYSAAVRETVRVLRSERHFGEQQETEGMPTQAASGPREALEASELRRQITEALKTLSPRRRRAVQAHLAGYTVNEIMGLFGWSYNKARNLIARGKAELRRALIERGVHD
ncbi:MAG: RNA polymerase sigma factor, partial [Thermoanaerobaculia bacterium]